MLAVPLGYKTGLGAGAAPAPTTERSRAWAFCGQATKSSRPAMLANFKKLVAGGFHHTFDDLDWDAASNLGTREYRDVLADAALAPCPIGWIHPDSFRLYEALEAQKPKAKESSAL